MDTMHRWQGGEGRIALLLLFSLYSITPYRQSLRATAYKKKKRRKEKNQASGVSSASKYENCRVLDANGWRWETILLTVITW